MSDLFHDAVRAVEWSDGALRLLDQRVLPQRQDYHTLRDARAVAEAIQMMVVRGAPAIGITAAYGVVLAARERYRASPGIWKQHLNADLDLLRASRPTAVNLAWALQRMGECAAGLQGDPFPALLEEAKAIHREDIEANYRMGELGAGLIGAPCGVLTHCNTGALATGGYGTALGVIRRGHAEGKVRRVFADETRPWLQGARLTAWELAQEGIPVTLLADAAAAYLMHRGEVQWVIVGADRIARNGDVANKIGTYALAIAARHHGVGFMVVAPTSTIDMALASGEGIPIELRSPEEVLHLGPQRTAAAGARAWNPAFDVTPAGLIDAIVTEKGVVHAPDVEGMAAVFRDPLSGVAAAPVL